MANSDYRYITVDEYKSSYYYGSLTDDEIASYISIAEKLIDKYVGWQNKFFPDRAYGKAESGTTTTLTDTNLSNYPDNYFNRCWVKILEGTNAGEERFIIDWDGSTSTLTVDVAFSSAIDNTSVYIIEQRSKFPRNVDFIDDDGVYYKYIPTDIKIATALQTEWIIKHGKDWLRDGGDRFDSEAIGDYSYRKAVRGKVESLICPQAVPYLNSFRHITGRFKI